jgi:ABC-type glycerol-3-phosphate transport system substrate-binding protein
LFQPYACVHDEEDQMKDQSKHSLSRRQMLKLLGAGSIGALLAACSAQTPEQTPLVEAETEGEGEKGPTTASKIEQGKLTCMLCCGTDDSRELQEKFNQWFMEQYPGIEATLELPPAGTNYFERLQTLVAAGTPPDVFDMWEGYVAPYAANGVLMDLTPFVEADPEWKMEDFQPAAVAASSYKDHRARLLPRPGDVLL